MGRYKQDLKTILTLLAAGMDPMQGLSMYQSALGDKRARVDERQQTRKYLTQDLMPTLQSGADWDQTKATLNSLGDAYDVGDRQVKKVKQNVLEDFYGGDREGENVFAEAEEDLGWDASDEEIVKKFTEQGAQLGYGRAEIRERLATKLRANGYEKYMPQVHQAIDMYFPTGASAYGDGDAVPRQDEWLKNWDQSGVQAPGGAPPPTNGPPATPERTLFPLQTGSLLDNIRAGSLSDDRGISSMWSGGGGLRGLANRVFDPERFETPYGVPFPWER